MIQFGNDEIKEIYYGSDKIKEVYYGSEKVWGTQPAVQDGYWVHKDTEVVTYFGADADFINNGVMSRPPWIADAVVIQLCSGITEFEITHYYYPEVGNYYVCEVFHENLETMANNVLMSLDMSQTTITELPFATISSGYFDGSNFVLGTFQYLVCPPTLQKFKGQSVFCNLPDYAYFSILNIPPSLNQIGEYFTQDGESHYSFGIGLQNPMGMKKGKLHLYTPTSNVAALTSLINTENAAGGGIFSPGGYEIIGT